jgi:chromosomal replication initiator protein
MLAEWERALVRLREQLGERSFATWIEPIRCEKDSKGLRLEVDSHFFQEWVTRHFLSSIRGALNGEEQSSVPVRIVVGRNGSANGKTPESGPTAAKRGETLPRLRLLKIGQLRPGYTFENFVVGDANEVAYKAARAVAEKPGKGFNPLFVWGRVGLGKTHLISAVAHASLTSRKRRIAFLSAETFTNSLITALRQDQMGAFRDRFRDLDALIIDDVEFLAGKERTQEEFFHTFNALYSAGKQVVLTSDRPPREIKNLAGRLCSRFEGGLIVDVRPPTEEMRLRILRAKAAAQGMELEEDVARSLSRLSGPSVRELEGALTRVLACASLTSGALSPQRVSEILGPVAVRPRVTIDAIQRLVGRKFELSVDQLRSHQRARSLAFARQVAMYLSRTVLEAPFSRIAEDFGGRDHSTVIYAVRTIEQKRHSNPSVGRLLECLESELRATNV